MNYFALLLVAVVVATPSPVAARSVLSLALDLLPDLQAVIASTPDDIKEAARVDGGNVEGATKAFTFFIPIVRKALDAEAKQKQTEVDPQTLDTLDRLERLIPGIFNLVAAASSGTPLGLDLEFPLPDFSKQGPGNVPVDPNEVEGETTRIFTGPQVPAFTAPQEPIYAAAQVPGQVAFRAPVATVPSQFDFDAAFKAAKVSGTQQTSVPQTQGVVNYALPGGGFFYSTGY